MVTRRLALVAAIVALVLALAAVPASAYDPTVLNSSAGAAVDNGTVAAAIEQLEATGASIGSPPAATADSIALANSMRSAGLGPGTLPATADPVPPLGASSLAGEVETVASNAGLTSGIGVVGKVLLPVGAFALGWGVGSVINSEFGHLWGSGPAKQPGPGSATCSATSCLSALTNQGVKYVAKGATIPGSSVVVGGGTTAKRNMWIYGWDVNTVGGTVYAYGTKAQAPASGANWLVAATQESIYNSCSGTPTLYEVTPPAGFKYSTNWSDFANTSATPGVPCTSIDGQTSSTPAEGIIWADARYWPARTAPRAKTSSDAPDVSGTDSTNRTYSATTVNNQLAGTNAADYPTLTAWLNNHYDPTTSPDDPLATIEVPADCGPGKLPTSCANALAAAGWRGTLSQSTATFTTANPALPARTIVTTTPKVGATIEPSASFSAIVNPGAAGMPAIVPTIDPGTDWATAAGSITTAGLQPVETIATTTDPQVGPNEVTHTSIAPAAGTEVHQGDQVTVEVNPSTAPVPAAGAGSCGLTPPSSSFDFSPITGANLLGHMPLSLLPWVSTQLASIATGPAIPNASFSAFGESVNLDSLSVFSGVVGVLRLLLTFGIWIGAALFLYSRTIGRG